MRRWITTLCAVACTLCVARDMHAQTIGFKLGVAMANQDWSGPELETGSTTGFAGGGLIRFGFGRLGIQAELLSITKGSDIEPSGAEVRMEYIEVPLLLHLPLLVGSSFSPYIMGGPSFGFEVDCELRNVPAAETCDSRIRERKKTDIGLSAGGGLAFALGPGALLLEGRYTWGMSNLSGIDGTEVKNKAAVLLAGYEISLGSR